MRNQTEKVRPRKTSSNTREDENGLAIYSGNRLVRRQYFGSMENVVPQDLDDSPLIRKVSRFRMEPSDEVKSTQLNAWTPSLAQLENPEFQTRWYFKFFLGTVHNNYVFTDINKEPHALSLCLTDLENHGIPQYRAILWKKSGCQRMCFPYVAGGKMFSPKEVLRLFNIDRFDKLPKEIITPNVQKELLVLEEQEGSVNFKFGVIYAKKGQATDDEMLGNVKGSEEFENFLHCLGDTVELKGWTGYRGGLDVVDNMTGLNSVYTMFEGHEVMFHVSVMLPYSNDTQQVERKRHIGNDIAVIVFADGEPEEEVSFKPASVRTKFTHVFAVVRFSKKTKSYWLTVYSEENVPVFGPPLPIPAKFTNPQEFRSFLLTKLMNGEKAAYRTPVFSKKRQRTLESLIQRLQNETQVRKPEKFVMKRTFSDQILSDKYRERKRVFLEIGQSLKVNKIMQGHAPTSVANIGGLLAVRNTPWTPQRTLSTFTSKIQCGDSYGTSLLISCDQGIFHVSDYGTRQIYDSSMSAAQINVLEDYGIFLIRTKKHGRIYVIPLEEIDRDRPFTICRRQCTRYYMKKTKGCHLYALSRQDSPFIALAFAVGKRISLYSWNEVSVWYANDENRKAAAQPPAGFEIESEFTVTESPRTLTIVHDINNELLLCLGLRNRFDVINAQTKKISVLKNIVTYRKPKIVSALDVFDENNPELLLTYSHTSVFVRLREGLTEIVSFNWNTTPVSIVCAYPYILGFSVNCIEIRLMVNGNLVHTFCVPHVTLITAKSDIYLASCEASKPENNRKKSSQLAQTFMKIKLSDLAGLNNARPNEDMKDGDIADILRRRNVGVYASYDHRPSKESKGISMHCRTFSAAASFSNPVSPERSPVMNGSIKVVKEAEDICDSSLDHVTHKNHTPVTHSLSTGPSSKSLSSNNDKPVMKSPSCSNVKDVNITRQNLGKNKLISNSTPLYKLEEQHEFNKTSSLPKDTPSSLVNDINTLPAKAKNGPHISFFYTPQKFSKRYSFQHPTQGGTGIKRKATSLKSLPDGQRYVHTASNIHDGKRLNKSLNTLLENNNAKWDLSVSQTSTFISKKTTIV